MRRFWKTKSLLGSIVFALKQKILGRSSYGGTEAYWKARYNWGGNSGAGSYGELAEFKAEVLNNFVQEMEIESVIEYGCGDGNQLKLYHFPSYLGFDVSERAVSLCKELFSNSPEKQFKLVVDYDEDAAELTLSIDVIYHLTEDEVFQEYMRRLFDSATRYVIIYSSDTEVQRPRQPPHVRHRQFTKWVQENRGEWKLLRHTPNRYPLSRREDRGSFADFFIYGRS